MSHPNLAKYELVLFDLDRTLAESKSPLAPEMAAALDNLLSSTKVGIISGGDYPQFEKNVIEHLGSASNLTSLYLAPTSGSKLYTFQGGNWVLEYADTIAEDERAELQAAILRAVAELGIEPEEIWGDIVEDRLTQVTYSALGQDAPADVKQAWDPDKSKRRPLAEKLIAQFGDRFDISMNGSTSVDIVKRGIDKAYGTKKIMELTGTSPEKVIFLGDALSPGENDYPVTTVGIETYEVRDPEETLQIILNSN